MNPLPRNRLDDTLNAILIAMATAALLTLAVEGARDDAHRPSAATMQAATPAPAAEIVASTHTAEER